MSDEGTIQKCSVLSIKHQSSACVLLSTVCTVLLNSTWRGDGNSLKIGTTGTNIHFLFICVVLFSSGSQQFSEYLRNSDKKKTDNKSEQKEGMQVHVSLMSHLKNQETDATKRCGLEHSPLAFLDFHLANKMRISSRLQRFLLSLSY